MIPLTVQSYICPLATKKHEDFFLNDFFEYFSMCYTQWKIYIISQNLPSVLDSWTSPILVLKTLNIIQRAPRSVPMFPPRLLYFETIVASMYVGPAAAPQRAASFWPPELWFCAAFFGLSPNFVLFQRDGWRSKEAVKVPEQGQEAQRQVKIFFGNHWFSCFYVLIVWFLTVEVPCKL